MRHGRFRSRALHLAIALLVIATLLGPGGPGARPALAGADACPEPNASMPAACFLGPDTPVAGYLDSAEDVDMYRVELPAAAMLVATLSSLPADYSLRLHAAEGATKAEALEPGSQDKVLRADGLSPGALYLSVFSLRGGYSAEQPYLLTVTFAPSTAMPAGAPAPSERVPGYVPTPASQYALTPEDAGPGFREVGRQELEGGRVFRRILLPADADIRGDPFGQFQFTRLSYTDVTWVWNSVFVAPYGEEAVLEAAFDQALSDMRNKSGLNVQPTQGWGSDQVYSMAWGSQGGYVRAILLRHHNAFSDVSFVGLERFATWDRISGMMRHVERRIHEALQ